MGLQPTALGGRNSVQGRRKWQPTPVFLPGKSYGQRSLAGYYHEVANSRTRQNTHITPTQAVSEGVGEFLVTIDMQETTPKLSGIKQSLQDFPAVVELWRIYLPIQGTPVRSLVQEDSTCLGATEPTSHSY